MRGAVRTILGRTQPAHLEGPKEDLHFLTLHTLSRKIGAREARIVDGLLVAQTFEQVLDEHVSSPLRSARAFSEAFTSGLVANHKRSL